MNDTNIKDKQGYPMNSGVKSSGECLEQSRDTSQPGVALGESKRLRLSVPYIVCDGCANSIKKALAMVSGIIEVDVDVLKKTVSICHDDQVNAESIIDVLERAGYSAS